MEDRTLLSTFLVDNTADSGPGSLRQAILDSNAATGQANTIDFHIPGCGVQTIVPLSALPAITQPVLIDGWSQPGYSGTPLIELSGSQVGTPDGLTDHGPGCHRAWPGHQWFLPGAAFTSREPARPATGSMATSWELIRPARRPCPTMWGSRSMREQTSNLVGTNGNGVDDASERNLLSGNRFAGVTIEGPGTSGNAVAGNWIGTDISGTNAIITDPGVRATIRRGDR